MLVTLVMLSGLAGDAVVLSGDWFSIFRTDGQLAWLAVPLSIAIIVAITNAINMMDEMDGLAASLLLPCSVLAVIGLYAGPPEALLPLCLAAPLLVFLAFNLSDGSRLPKLFLGDAGSMTLGFMLASLPSRCCVLSGRRRRVCYWHQKRLNPPLFRVFLGV